MQEMQVQSLDQEDSLEEEMAIHTSILAWRITWIGCSPWGHRVRHNLPTEHTHTLPSKVCILWPLQSNYYPCCIASAAAHYRCLAFCTWVQWKQFGSPESASTAGPGITNLSDTCKIPALCASCACTHLYLGTFSIIQPWPSITLKFLIWNIVT